MHNQPLAAPRLPGVIGSGGIAIGPGGIVDLGGIAIGFGVGSVDVNPDGIAIGPGGGVAGFRGSRKCLELVKV